MLTAKQENSLKDKDDCRLLSLEECFQCRLLYCENTFIYFTYWLRTYVYIYFIYTSVFTRVTNDNKLLVRYTSLVELS